MELLKEMEARKALLIDQLLANGIYKTKDERHLYDAPLHVLEAEYQLIINHESATSWFM